MSHHPSILKEDSEVSSDVAGSVQCPFCSKSFSSEEFLSWHAKYVHSSVKSQELDDKSTSGESDISESHVDDALEGIGVKDEIDKTFSPQESNSIEDKDTDCSSDAFHCNTVYIKEENIYDEAADDSPETHKESVDFNISPML